MADQPYLIYVGDGTAFHDVPARDLTEAECRKLDVNALIASGLYEYPPRSMTPIEQEIPRPPRRSKEEPKGVEKT